jgi:IS1 family transposase
MNTLSRPMQVRVLSLLCEGSSIRATERLTGVHRDTVMRLGVRVGNACTALHDRTVRELIPSMIQLDEIWAYVSKKQGHLAEGDPEAWGDQYTFVATDTLTKLTISYLTGKRTAESTQCFAEDLRGRVLGRPHLVSDGFNAYPDAIERAFGVKVDYAQVIKDFSGDPAEESARRYSPGVFIGVEKRAVMGSPDLDASHTCHVERQNLTMRMHMRRMTRLTNAFSKKVENLSAAVGLHFGFVNFVRVHQTLRVTPAMAADLTDHVWSMEELLDAAEAAHAEGPPPPPPQRVSVAVNDGRRALPAGPTLRLLPGGRS